ncbi:methyltransferase domain-containing protein [Herbaspirillum frisingense]|uniref:methyltransferase domain-containing protein n=1 Tax=Herbaspirillum frisingense TaxID=92645 RepID=UPI0039B065F1
MDETQQMNVAQNMAVNFPQRMVRERVARHCPCCGSSEIIPSPAVLMPFVAHRVFGWTPVVIDASWGLNTIPAGHAYSVCNTLTCEDCGFLFLDIRFSDAELDALYAGYRNEAYTSLREHYEPGYRQRNAALKQGTVDISYKESFLRPLLALPCRILDWGGDTGKNTPFKSDNRCLHIHDISNEPVIPGAQRVRREELERGAHELIINSHVIEHVPYPADMLLEIRALMDEHSLFYLEVPLEEVVRLNASTEARRTGKRHWHEHINFFTRQALLSLIRACDLELVAFEERNIGSEERPAWIFQVACKLAYQR